MYEFKMPSLGADMTEGTLTAWNVEIGDAVQRGDVICEVETNKGDIDVEIWEDGVVEKLCVDPGEKLPVGEVIAVIDTGEEVIEEPQQERPEEEPKKKPEPAPPALDPADLRVPEGVMASPAARRKAAELGVDLKKVEGTGLKGAITADDVQRVHRGEKPPPEPEAAEKPPRATPMAKKIARRQGIDLDDVEGSGPHGAIRREDVEASMADIGPAEQEPDERRERMAAMREAIASAMARSKRDIPHYYLHETVPMARATKWVHDYNADRSPADRLLVGVVVLKAVALACREFPEMNGVYEEDGYRPLDDINPGFAIAQRNGGVIPPAVHDADSRKLPELMDDVRDLVRRVRRGKLRSSEVTDATITVTSLGDLGVEAVYGVIYPPQVAIVGVGKITDRLFVEDGLIGTGPAATITLSGDHRVSDGIAGARFLSTISELLQHPEQL